MTASMPKGEREDLQRLIRQREKVLTSRAKQRSSELIADFENQMGSTYFADDDEVWERVTEAARQVVDRAKEQIALRCRELGIPDQFAPTLSLDWKHRGYGNQLKDRRAELRLMAETRIEAMERKAITEIQVSCLAAQEQIALAGLTSEAAKQFISRLPGIETLMPSLSFEEVAEKSDLPVAEQLVSPNTLRQRRFREKQRALQNGNAVTQDRNGDDQDEEGDA
jgi:hypothetical protein